MESIVLYILSMISVFVKNYNYILILIYIIINMTHQLSNTRILNDYEIEFNGQIFNCLECDKNNCCSTTSNAVNKIACQKCSCQNMYITTDGSRQNNQPINNLNCENCLITDKMNETECNLYGFLNNQLIENNTIVDCSNKIIVGGSNNAIDNATLKSVCNTNSTMPTISNNNQINNNSIVNVINNLDSQTQLIVLAIGVFIIILILYLLFR